METLSTEQVLVNLRNFRKTSKNVYLRHPMSPTTKPGNKSRYKAVPLMLLNQIAISMFPSHKGIGHYFQL